MNNYRQSLFILSLICIFGLLHAMQWFIILDLMERKPVIVTTAPCICDVSLEMLYETGVRLDEVEEEVRVLHPIRDLPMAAERELY